MIDVIPEWALTALDEAQISALLATCFPTDYGGRSFYQQRPHLRLVWRDGPIVAHMAVFVRAIRLDGALCDVIGIGDVATDPAYRRLGIATALLDHALTIGAQGPARFAILFGRHSVYTSAGFRNAPNRLVHVDLTGAETGGIHTTGSEFFMVRPLGDTPWPTRASVDLLGPMV